MSTPCACEEDDRIFTGLTIDLYRRDLNWPTLTGDNARAWTESLCDIDFRVIGRTFYASNRMGQALTAEQFRSVAQALEAELRRPPKGIVRGCSVCLDIGYTGLRDWRGDLVRNPLAQVYAVWGCPDHRTGWQVSQPEHEALNRLFPNDPGHAQSPLLAQGSKRAIVRAAALLAEHGREMARVPKEALRGIDTAQVSQALQAA